MNPLLKKRKALLDRTTESVADDAKTTSEKTAQLEPYNQVSQLVGAGNTKEALELLIQLQGNEDYFWQLLQKRFDKNEDDYQLKRIDFDNWMRTLAQMNSSLLQMLPKNDKKEGIISLDDMSKLLKKGKIKKAINQLVKVNYEGAFMIQARFNLGQKAFVDKRITEQIWQSEQNQLIVSILNIVWKAEKAVEKEEAPLNSKDAIRELVANAQLEKALDLLIQTGNNEAQLLKTRLLDALRQAAMDKSGYSSFDAICNEIAGSVLNIIEPPKPKNKSNSDKVEPPIENILVPKKTVEALISHGKTEDALVLLQKWGYPEATVLYDRFKAHKRSLHLGMLQYAEWTALEKEWHEEILIWQYAEDTTPQKILSPTDKLHIQQLLQLNKTKEALDFGKDFGNAFFLLLGSYNQIIGTSKMGLITEADKKLQLEAINAAIRHLIA